MKERNVNEALLLERLFDKLWPLNRSLSGEGVRKSLEVLKELIPIELIEVPSGSKVGDWIVPAEWNCREAWIETPDGRRICDYSQNNLHLLGYSVAVDLKVGFEELEKHLHSIPAMPEAVPYATSYYEPAWGFCISHGELQSLPRDGSYRVYIDCTHDEDGSMTLGEAYLKGESDQEFILSTYVCHPSMANNELSGPLLTSLLYDRLKQWDERMLNYRFLFGPETIGAIAHLHHNKIKWDDALVGGLVVSCVGLDSKYVYKQSKNPDSALDRIAANILQHKVGDNFEVIPFFPKGSDERQYCSPGFNYMVGSLTRGMYYRYPEYHSSLDNKSLISFDAMVQTADIYESILKGIELDQFYINNEPYGEPQLGRRGLYPSLSKRDQREKVMDEMMWLLSYSDGQTPLIEIAEKSGICILDFEKSIATLIGAGLLDARSQSNY